MVYESSYESGRKPFRPDTTRGFWASPNDFLYACWGLAFKMDAFSLMWYRFFEFGIFSIIPYLVCMVLFVVPIILIQSFMGQFSSSGFISVFRIAPLFKGIGYISFALNFSILTYYSIFAAIPLNYLFHSMRPTLPWSCESYLEWARDVPELTVQGNRNICNNKTITGRNTVFPLDGENNDNYTTSYSHHYKPPIQIPSVEFFRSYFKNYSFMKSRYEEFYMPWQLVFSMFFVWILVALIFYKFGKSEKMGKFIRYTMWLLITMLSICLLRLIFLTDARKALRDFILPRLRDVNISGNSIPILAVSSFGAGWGTIVSLASYNKFKTNIMRFSWFICLGQLLIFILTGLAPFLINRHIKSLTRAYFYPISKHYWEVFLASGSALADMELSNMWCILFYSMMGLSAMLIIVTQLFAMLTAIFDEFEFLRQRKLEVTLGLIGMLALSSIFFCSNRGLTHFTALPADAMFTQTALNLLLLLVVLWIYGRVRFQRDIEFMLGQRFATWRVYMLRFVAPIALLIILIFSTIIAFLEHLISGSITVIILALSLIVIPWLFIPGYAILIIIQTTGSLCLRLRRCCRPTDWYPVDPDERQRYEDAMGNMDITHQLNEVEST